MNNQQPKKRQKYKTYCYKMPKSVKLKRENACFKKREVIQENRVIKIYKEKQIKKTKTLIEKNS